MPQIDIGAVLKAKAPRLARWIPRPAVGWLRRTIHEKEINHILYYYNNTFSFCLEKQAHFFLAARKYNK